MYRTFIFLLIKRATLKGKNLLPGSPKPSLKRDFGIREANTVPWSGFPLKIEVNCHIRVLSLRYISFYLAGPHSLVDRKVDS